MANVTVYQSINMASAYVWYGNVTTYNSSHIQISDGYYTQNYYGTFYYDAYGLSGGTLTSTNLYQGGYKVYEISGGSYSALTVYNYLNSGNIQGLYNYALYGNDTFYGSAYNDYLIGFAGNDALYGNGGADTLVGGYGDDVINGGSNADNMMGGAGNDTYVVDNASDVIVELSGEGYDIVDSSINYTLASNVEKLVLTGTNAINGAGNSLSNQLIGNDANNILKGKEGVDTLIGNNGNDTLDGGAGADTLKGGVGDDIYKVDNASDIVTELTGEGYDTVKSRISHVLTANVEKLVLTGTKEISGTGNGLNNILVGNKKNNVLKGMGGRDVIKGGGGNDVLIGAKGNDILTGGPGRDKFKFVSQAEKQDRITDFASGTDKIQVVSKNFGNLPLGTLADSRFRGNLSGNAKDSNDRFIFETDTGILRYDPDGTGSMAAVPIATLGDGRIIKASDIQIVTA